MLPALWQRHYKVILKSFMVHEGWFNREILCLGRSFPVPVMSLNLDTSSFYHEWFLKCNERIQEFGVGTVRRWFLLNNEGAQKSLINNWMCVHVICRRPKLNICVTSDIVGGHGSLSPGLPDRQTLALWVTAQTDPSITFDNGKTNIDVRPRLTNAVFQTLFVRHWVTAWKPSCWWARKRLLWVVGTELVGKMVLPCVFLYSLHIECQNAYSTSKVKAYFKVNGILAV